MGIRLVEAYETEQSDYADEYVFAASATLAAGAGAPLTAAGAAAASQAPQPTAGGNRTDAPAGMMPRRSRFTSGAAGRQGASAGALAKAVAAGLCVAAALAL